MTVPTSAIAAPARVPAPAQAKPPANLSPEQRQRAGLESQLRKLEPRIFELLPRKRIADPHSFIRMVVMATVRNPKLLFADRESLLMAAMNCAELGLSCSGGPASRAHLIPYGGKVQCIPDYKGFIDIALDSGKVKAVDADVVREKDQFELRRGTENKIVHVPRLKDAGEIIAAYAVAWLADGQTSFRVMPVDEINTHRDRSSNVIAAKKYKKKTPWDTDYGEMAKKTVIRALYKYLPTTPEMQRAEEVASAEETGSDIALATVGIGDALEAEGFTLSEAEVKERGELVSALTKIKMHETGRFHAALDDLGMSEDTKLETMGLDAVRQLAMNLGNAAGGNGGAS